MRKPHHLTALTLLAVSWPGCGGSCSPQEQLFEPEAGCAADAPTSAGVSIVLGTDEGQGFRELTDGATLQMDYGPQGGQHVYYSVRVAGALEGDQLQGSLSEGGTNVGSSVLAVCPAGQWSEVTNNYTQLAVDEEISTTLIVKVLRCEATEPCDFYDEGAGPSPTTVAEARAKITAVP